MGIILGSLFSGSGSKQLYSQKIAPKTDISTDKNQDPQTLEWFGPQLWKVLPKIDPKTDISIDKNPSKIDPFKDLPNVNTFNKSAQYRKSVVCGGVGEKLQPPIQWWLQALSFNL